MSSDEKTLIPAIHALAAKNANIVAQYNLLESFS